MASQVPTGVCVWEGGLGFRTATFCSAARGLHLGSGWLPCGVAQEVLSCPASAGAAPWGMPRCGASGECREGKREGDSVRSPKEGLVILEGRGRNSLQVGEKVSY